MENSIGVDDVTKKIKTAITNKLIDLGSYVDEELPDYIMVMVANKKTHTQMTNDLNLFLGSNTQNFTTWLHGILDTVQTGPEESKNAKEKHKDDKKQKLAKSETIKEKDSTTKKPSNEDKLGPKSITNKRKSVDTEVISSTDTREENEDVISFRTETDDVLTKELQQEDEKLTPENTTKPKKSISAVEKPQNMENTKRLPISFPKKEEPKAAIKIRPMLQRKGPISTVSSVIRKPPKVKPFTFAEDDDEEYDPCKPSVGTIASIVRVTERRSSVPPALQANKLLLFKAIEDANKSITKKSGIRGSARVAPYKPTPIQIEPMKPEERSQNIEVIVEKLPERIIEIEPELPEDLKMDVPAMENVLQVLTLKKASPLKVGNVTNEQVIEVLEEMDPSILVAPSSTVIITNSKGVKRKIEDESLEIQTNTIASVESIPEAPLHTKFVVTLDGVNPSTIFKKPRNSSDSEVPSTKRIFTSVPSSIDQEMYDELEFMETDQYVIEDDDDDNDEMLCVNYTEEMEDTLEEVADAVTKNVRCQFWPACVRGEKCIYIHPTQPCKNFPACHFGSKCIKIHPNCKFDSQCTRPDCPFTHASKRNTVTLAPIQIRKPKVIIPPSKPPPTANVPICKFFPKCTNSKCVFIHPKMCHYGSFCKTQGCPFTHPKTPSVEKLKWTAANKVEKQLGGI